MPNKEPTNKESERLEKEVIKEFLSPSEAGKVELYEDRFNSVTEVEKCADMHPACGFGVLCEWCGVIPPQEKVEKFYCGNCKGEVVANGEHICPPTEKCGKLILRLNDSAIPCPNKLPCPITELGGRHSGEVEKPWSESCNRCKSTEPHTHSQPQEKVEKVKLNQPYKAEIKECSDCGRQEIPTTDSPEVEKDIYESKGGYCRVCTGILDGGACLESEKHEKALESFIAKEIDAARKEFKRIDDLRQIEWDEKIAEATISERQRIVEIVNEHRSRKYTKDDSWNDGYEKALLGVLDEIQNPQAERKTK